MPQLIRIRDPRAEMAAFNQTTLPTLSELSGKTFAIVSNGWTSMDRIGARLVEGLKARYAIGEVLRFTVPIASPGAPEVFNAIVERADFAVVGLAN